MSAKGTTKKQLEQAIQRLTSAGMKAWPTATGNHALWVINAEAFPLDTSRCGRITVPRVDSFIKNFAATGGAA